MLLKELRKQKFNNLIIEGNFLLPELVKERFEYPYKAVWLVPTLKFQNKVYMERDWVSELLQRSDNPSLALHNWIQRDHKFNKIIEEQAERCGFKYFRVDGTHELDYTVRWAEKNLDIKDKVTAKRA